MIPHPDVASALREARGNRRKARAAVLRRAEADARLAGLSMRCQSAVQAGLAPDRHGCGNDGSGCLCVCHDTCTASDVVCVHRWPAGAAAGALCQCGQRTWTDPEGDRP